MTTFKVLIDLDRESGIEEILFDELSSAFGEFLNQIKEAQSDDDYDDVIISLVANDGGFDENIMKYDNRYSWSRLYLCHGLRADDRHEAVINKDKVYELSQLDI